MSSFWYEFAVEIRRWLFKEVTRVWRCLNTVCRCGVEWREKSHVPVESSIIIISVEKLNLFECVGTWEVAGKCKTFWKLKYLLSCSKELSLTWQRSDACSRKCKVLSFRSFAVQSRGTSAMNHSSCYATKSWCVAHRRTDFPRPDRFLQDGAWNTGRPIEAEAQMSALSLSNNEETL